MPEPGAPPAYSLRPATADDYPFLYDLHVASMKNDVAQTWDWDDAVQQEMFAANFHPERLQIVVAEGCDVGVLVVERRPADWFLAGIEITPDCQGRGLGAAIVRDILATAARDGLPVRLQVLKVNSARRLYERLGFVVAGETPTHHLMVAAPRAPGQEGE